MPCCAYSGSICAKIWTHLKGEEKMLAQNSLVSLRLSLWLVTINPFDPLKRGGIFLLFFPLEERKSILFCLSIFLAQSSLVHTKDAFVERTSSCFNWYLRSKRWVEGDQDAYLKGTDTAASVGTVVA